METTGKINMVIFIFLITVLINCTRSVQDVLTEDQILELQNDYQKKHYFSLRDAVQSYDRLSTLELTFYRGIVNNKFHRLPLSIDQLNTYIRKARDNMDKDRLIECYKILGDSYTKTFQYKEAAEGYETILTEFGDQLDEEQRSDFENYLTIFRALKDVPRQTVIFRDDTKLQTVDGGYLPLRINGQDIRLGPDTGANYSVIIRSLAEQVHMRIIDAEVDVDNVAGQKVRAHPGVASEMEIGNALLKNVVFLVFEDRDLYFPEADMQIMGVIGFPVFEALREVTLHRDGAFSIPLRPRSFTEHNMCLDDLTPVIAGYYQGQRHAFCMDTGAGKSVLYPPFFKTYTDDITAQNTLQTERIQGFSGFRDIPAYQKRDFKITVSGREAFFLEIPVLTEYTIDDSRHFYGNIGRDLVHQFEKMTLSFESMSIVFE